MASIGRPATMGDETRRRVTLYMNPAIISRLAAVSTFKGITMGRVIEDFFKDHGVVLTNKEVFFRCPTK